MIGSLRAGKSAEKCQSTIKAGANNARVQRPVVL
jgi:hypothetical protein